MLQGNIAGHYSTVLSELLKLLAYHSLSFITLFQEKLWESLQNLRGIRKLSNFESMLERFDGGGERGVYQRGTTTPMGQCVLERISQSRMRWSALRTCFRE